MQKKLIKVEGSVTFENVFSSIDEEPFLLCGQGWSTNEPSWFLTRGYARAYHELLQGLRYANESLTHS